MKKPLGKFVQTKFVQKEVGETLNREEDSTKWENRQTRYRREDQWKRAEQDWIQDRTRANTRMGNKTVLGVDSQDLE